MTFGLLFVQETKSFELLQLFCLISTMKYDLLVLRKPFFQAKFNLDSEWLFESENIKRTSNNTFRLDSELAHNKRPTFWKKKPSFYNSNRINRHNKKKAWKYCLFWNGSVKFDWTANNNNDNIVTTEIVQNHYKSLNNSDSFS